VRQRCRGRGRFRFRPRRISIVVAGFADVMTMRRMTLFGHGLLAGLAPAYAM
jgi:hypothetical protein